MLKLTTAFQISDQRSTVLLPLRNHKFHALSVNSDVILHSSVTSSLLPIDALNFDCQDNGKTKTTKNAALFRYNSLIKNSLQNQRSQDALILFRRLLLTPGIVPDEFTLPCVIKACANLRSTVEGRMVHGLAVKLGFGSGSGVHVESSLVSLYSKCGDVTAAQKVFDKMSVRDLVSWNALLDGYAKSEDDALLRLFYEMPERDAFSWTVLIDGLAKSGSFGKAKEMFDRMPEKNVASCNAMINGFMKSGDCKSARLLFEQMIEKSVITWNSMISGYEMNRKFLEAVMLFRDMIIKGLSANMATFVSTLSAVSGLASLSKGKSLHAYILKCDCRLDGVLGTALIEMYSKCGSAEIALTVFRVISGKKLGHWTAIIVGLGSHGMAKYAFELFHEMRHNSVTPDGITFIGLLNACSHAGLVDDGKRYFDMMINEYGIEPTVQHYGCLVDILCRSNLLEEAKHTVETMPMEPNKVIWMSLLSGARNQQNVSIGEYTARRMMEVSPETIHCYVLLSNIYAAAGQWKKVSHVREMLKSRGFRKEPGFSAIEHMGVVHEFRAGDLSHPESELILSKLSEMKDKLRLVGHVPDTTQVLLFIEDEMEKEAELERHSERLAIAYGLIHVERNTVIRIVKNLRICDDCHSVTKLLSTIYDRKIVVRDGKRFHHFKNGLCSCNDYW